MPRTLAAGEEKKPRRWRALRVGAINEMECEGTKWFFYLPSQLKRDKRRPLPVVVSVHGAGSELEGARGCAQAFVDFAERRRVAVIAPFFIDNHPHFQYLSIGGNRADLRLLEILEDAKARVPILYIKRVYLFGHSGGGQFAHRFALVHPHRILKGGASAAGGYTFPKPDLTYPGGTQKRRHPLPEFQFAKFVQLPFAILVGDQDTGQLQDNELPNGQNRFERARNFYATLKDYARERKLPFRLLYQVHAGRDHSCFGTSARWVIRNVFEKR